MKGSIAVKAAVVTCGVAMTLTACSQSSPDQYNWKDMPAQTMPVGDSQTVILYSNADGTTPSEYARERNEDSRVLAHTYTQESCDLAYGATLTAVKKSGDSILAVYHSKGVFDGDSFAPCGDGAQVVVSSTYFASMSAAYEREKKAVAVSRGTVNYLAEHPAKKSAVRSVGTDTSVYEVPILRNARRQCSLEGNEYVRSLGSANGLTLLERVQVEGVESDIVYPAAANSHCYGDKFLVDTATFEKMSVAPKDVLFRR